MDDSLVSRRPRRSTAGNRMEAALAEIALEDAKDIEDDKDFTIETFEEDAFESDFDSESNEEEEDGQDGETAVENEEKQARKSARTRIERATAAAHARQKLTFDPTALESASKTKPKDNVKRARRVSLGFAINAETGEVIVDHDNNDPSSSTDAGSGKRSSKRQTTIQNTTATVKRYLKSEEKKAHNPKRQRPSSVQLTQAQLIARALDTEEGNLVQHRDYLMLEEEKRKRARVARVGVEGERVRWISKAEVVQVPRVEQAPSAPVQTVPGKGPVPFAYNPYGYSFSPILSPSSTTSAVPYSHSNYLNQLQKMLVSAVPSTSSSTSTSTSTPSSSSISTVTSGTTAQTLTSASNATTVQVSTPIPASVQTSSTTSNPFSHPQSIAVLPYQPYTLPPTQSQPSAPPEKTEKVAKSYLIHEYSQHSQHSSATTPPPPTNPHPQSSRRQSETLNAKAKFTWGETMTALFGSHVDWESDEFKVYSNQGPGKRPLSRTTPTCYITSLPARYLDPRTGVPYANAEAYGVLTRLLEHGFDWDNELGCYFGSGFESAELIERQSGQMDSLT